MNDVQVAALLHEIHELNKNMAIIAEQLVKLANTPIICKQEDLSPPTFPTIFGQSR